MQDASAAQILAVNQLVAADQTRTSIKCRSRWLRALTTTETDILDAGRVGLFFLYLRYNIGG